MASYVKAKSAEIKVAMSSKHEMYKFLQAKDAPENGVKALYNEDLLPTPPEQRTWSTLHYFAFYMTVTFSPSSYNLGATLVSLGLLWWHGLVAAVIGSIILVACLVANSRGAIKYHVGFPVYVRFSAGISGSKLFICVRAIVATIYFSIQTYYAGRLMSVMLFAIFGNSWQNIPNTLPTSAGITSRDLLAFMLFWLVQFPVMFIHPRRLRWVYVFKAVYTPACLFGVLGWAVAMNGGSIGNISGLGTKHLEGGDLVWPMLQAINSVLGAFCPILINAPDVARYAKSGSSPTSAQFGAILLSKVLVMFIGCATTSAAAAFLGTTYWNVWDLYTNILINYWSPAARAGMFFASTGLMIAVLVTNAGSNSLPVGADMAGIAPRWINIRRGQVACAIVAPLMVPWKIIANAATFLTFLGSYTVFLCPIMGIMIVDYFFMRKGNIHIPSLYDGSSTGLYHFYKGWNLRAMVAWVCGVAFVVHGVAGSINANSVGDASKNMYKLGFILSTIMGMLVYYCICLVWPVQILPDGHAGEVLAFEELAKTEGFFEGETLEDITGHYHLDGVMPVEGSGVVTPTYEKSATADEKSV